MIARSESLEELFEKFNKAAMAIDYMRSGMPCEREHIQDAYQWLERNIPRREFWIFQGTLSRRFQDNLALNRALYGLHGEGDSPRGMYLHPDKMYKDYCDEMNIFAKVAYERNSTQSEMAQVWRFCLAVSNIGFRVRESSTAA